jgi:hypothetical protein
MTLTNEDYMEVCGCFCNLRIFVSSYLRIFVSSYLRIFVCDGGTILIDMTQMLFGVRSAKLPVTTGFNGALSNSKLFYNRQLCCANIESSAKQVSQC